MNSRTRSKTINHCQRMRQLRFRLITGLNLLIQDLEEYGKGQEYLRQVLASLGLPALRAQHLEEAKLR